MSGYRNRFYEAIGVRDDGDWALFLVLVVIVFALVVGLIKVLT